MKKQTTASETPYLSVAEQNIAQWKALHGKIFSIDTTDDELKPVQGWFKRPDMKTLSAVVALAKKDEMGASNLLFDSCWLGGDELMRSDISIRLSAMAKLGDLLQAKQATLKNW